MKIEVIFLDFISKLENGQHFFSKLNLSFPMTISIHSSTTTNSPATCLNISYPHILCLTKKNEGGQDRIYIKLSKQ